MVKWDNYYLTAHPHTHTYTHTHTTTFASRIKLKLCRPTCGFGGKFQGLLLEPDSLVTTHTLPPSQLAPYHPHNSHPTTLTTHTLPPSQLAPYHHHNSHPTTLNLYPTTLTTHTLPPSQLTLYHTPLWKPFQQYLCTV